MPSDHIEYYRTRASEERAAIGNSESSDIAAIHRQLAEMYDKLVEELMIANSDTSVAA